MSPDRRTPRAPRTANQDNLEALGREVDAAERQQRKAKGGRSPRHHRLRWALGACIAVVLLLIGALGGYAWYLAREVHRIDVRGLSSDLGEGPEAGTENILMVGSTTRCGLAHQNIAYGLCAQGVTGVNSDVVMILHLNPSVPSVSILSIPRDLFVPNARKTGAYKVDAALAEGPTQLVAAVEEDFGIPIQHYVELNFDTFANVVNALGGINMYFPEPVYDSYSGLDVQTTGCLHLDGYHALQVVRARHLQYKGPGVTTDDPAYWPQEAQSDLARIQRDHEFLRVLAAAVSKRGLSNPATDLSLIAAVAPQLTVDKGLSPHDMLNLILTYHGVSIEKSPQLTLPVLVDQFGDYVYQGSDYGDVEFPDQPQDRDTIDRFLGVPPGTATMTGAHLPAPASVSVSVLNGSGVPDQASDTALALGQYGFDVVGSGDTTPVGQEAETVVTYAHRTTKDEAAAQEVASAMSGSVIIAHGPTFDGAQVTVTTGTNYWMNPPASPGGTTTTTTTTAHRTTTSQARAHTGTTGTTTSAPTTTTTTEPPSIADGTFSPPSAATEALAPWDPRSCTANGGEGH